MIKTFQITTTIEVDTECFDAQPVEVMRYLDQAVNRGEGVWIQLLGESVTLTDEVRDDA